MMRRLLAVLAILTPLTANAAIEIQGQSVEVVDPHLHPGNWGGMNPNGKSFLVGALPGNMRLYAPALFDALLDPWAPHVGIRAQTDWAGIDHVGLLATYTHHTSGYYTNRDLLTALTSERNDGWAWGLLSINLDDFSNPALAAGRVDAMASYLERAPDLFIGVKLAHAHQGMRLDDEAILPVYDLAAAHGLPVLLHSGFSPFPGSETDPAYYDPAYLEPIAAAYDGREGRPHVDFVLAHMGQGDARSIEHALDMAADHDNIWLELSALARPLMIDEDGNPIESTDLQYTWAIEEIRERGLTDRTLFATDGAQFSGMVFTYVNRISEAMLAAEYSLEQIRAVMAGNFYSLFF